MKLFLKIFLILRILNASSPYQVVKIGGLFFNNELDILEAFDAAINDVNDLNTDFRLEPVKHFLSQDDSIILQQLTCDLMDQGVRCRHFWPKFKDYKCRGSNMECDSNSHYLDLAASDYELAFRFNSL
ncbi:hypothetical protein DOY81_012899 [Sarcophaga bullata]|nr:hypothetical protein DOY81_012899 [Sarcophaga bullata]